MAAKTGSRREYVVLAHAFDGAKAAPVIAEDRPAGLQFRHSHTLSTSSPLTRAYFSSEHARETRATRSGSAPRMSSERQGSTTAVARPASGIRTARSPLSPRAGAWIG